MTNKKHDITPQLPFETKDLVADLRQIIDNARARVASTANYAPLSSAGWYGWDVMWRTTPIPTLISRRFLTL